MQLFHYPSMQWWYCRCYISLLECFRFLKYNISTLQIFYPPGPADRIGTSLVPRLNCVQSLHCIVLYPLWSVCLFSHKILCLFSLFKYLKRSVHEDISLLIKTFFSPKLHGARLSHLLRKNAKSSLVSASQISG